MSAGLIAYVFQGPGTSGDLAVIDGGEVRVISDFCASLRETGVLPPDYGDVMDFLEGVLASSPKLNSERLGVMGGSYGGYLSAWIIAHDHRFAAAIVERGFLDPVAFIGTSDIGDFYGDEHIGTDPDLVLAQSPQAWVAGVTTPTLVMHSEQDLRCPLEQAERYYASLIRQGTVAELLVFPCEDHELSRSGRPRHRVERFDAILDWWKRHLPTAPRDDS